MYIYNTFEIENNFFRIVIILPHIKLKNRNLTKINFDMLLLFLT